MNQEEEIAYLKSIQGQPFLRRVAGYFRFSGPGFFQSAITLGGGTASACFVAGSAFGYQLLWVQPVAMILGITLMAAIARQTLHSGQRTYQVFWDRLHPALALLWAVSALLASVIWHFPQYGVATNAVTDAAVQFGLELSPWSVAIPILIASIIISWTYDSGLRGIQIYEWIMKTLVWSCVGIFGVVAVATGIDWNELFLGLFTFQIPDDPRAVTTIIGALSAAVGINMVFLYPYSLLRKKWGRHHEGAAYFDLLSGMFVPYVLATTFIIVGTANTVHKTGGQAQGLMDLLPVLSHSLSPELSAILLGSGLFAIGVSSITVQMLAAGFICTEMFRLPQSGWPYRLCMLVPTIGILGATIRSPYWAAILAASFAVIFMPLAMICFLYLLNDKGYMGPARLSGPKAWLWNSVIGFSVLVMTVATVITYYGRL